MKRFVCFFVALLVFVSNISINASNDLRVTTKSQMVELEYLPQDVKENILNRQKNILKQGFTIDSTEIYVIEHNEMSDTNNNMTIFTVKPEDQYGGYKEYYVKTNFHKDSSPKLPRGLKGLLNATFEIVLDNHPYTAKYRNVVSALQKYWRILTDYKSSGDFLNITTHCVTTDRIFRGKTKWSGNQEVDLVKVYRKDYEHITVGRALMSDGTVKKLDGTTYDKKISRNYYNTNWIINGIRYVKSSSYPMPAISD